MMRIAEWKKKNLLTIVFEKGLNQGGGTPVTYFFDTIYAPVKIPSASGMPADYTYMPVGWSYSDIASIYGNKFAGNFWPQWFEDSAALNAAIAAYDCIAVDRIQDVLTQNEYKYRKLIELQGFAWNPLWNVDGTVLRSHVEQHSDEEVSTATDLTTARKVMPYDDTTPKTAAEDNTSGSAENNTVTTKHLADAHSVAATDNAFGEALTTADIYHAEKEVRTGNIGVTKSTELIEAARKTLAWNLLDVFFEDINQQLLIGIY